MYLNEMTLQIEILTLITPLSNNEIMLRNKLNRHPGYKLAFSPVRQLRFIHRASKETTSSLELLRLSLTVRIGLKIVKHR